MGQILHRSAKTPATVRRAIQDSQESLIVLARALKIARPGRPSHNPAPDPVVLASSACLARHLLPAGCGR